MIQTDQLDILVELKAQGLLITCPPTDDNDAYIIAIAWSNNDNQVTDDTENTGFNRCGRGYILSCDLFRDTVDQNCGDREFRAWI